MTFKNQEKQRLFQRYGKWAIVTGASSGIGKELAMRLADSGLHLVICARSVQALESVAAYAKQQGGQAVTIAADLTTPAGVNTLLEAANGLDIGLLVASAGYGTSGSFLQTALEDEVNMVRLNCEALLSLTHHFARYFAQRKRGGIVLLSSIVAFQGVPFAANYAATKAYVQSLAEALALELAPYQVDVLAAAPGPVASGFGQRAGMTMGMALTPEQVGLPILQALGRSHSVLPGFLSKLLVYSLRTVPRWGKIRIMKNIMAGMAKKT